MAHNAENIGDISRKIVEQKNAIDANLDGFVMDQNHPKYGEVLRIKTQAQSLLDQAQMSFGIANGYEGVRQAFKKLGELYLHSMQIRASMLPSSIETAAREPMASLERRMDRYRDIGLVKPIIGKLQSIARGLAVDPANVLSSGSAPNNRYYRKEGAELAVNLGLVDEDKKQIDELRQQKMLDAFPELSGDILGRLEAGLNQLKTFNPLRLANYEKFVQRDNLRHKTDYRPVRVVLALAGGLLSGLGFTYSIFTGNPLTWPTLAWAAVSGFSLYPNLLQGADRNAMESIARLNTPALHKLMSEGFKGEQGLKAFTELQSLDPAKRKMFQQLAVSKEPIQTAQIGALTDGKNTALFSMLKTIPSKLSQTFAAMGKPLSERDKEFMAAVIKNLPV